MKTSGYTCFYEALTPNQYIQNGTRTVAPKKNCPPVRVSFRVGGQFSSEATVLEPFKTNHMLTPKELLIVFQSLEICNPIIC